MNGVPLTRLRCSAYRAFAGAYDLELRPLNIIFGRNGSGKTSLIRLPELLTRGLQGGTASLADVLSGEKEERAIELVHGAAGGSLNLGLDYCPKASLSKGHASLDVTLRILPGTQRAALRPSVEIESWCWKQAAGPALALKAGTWFKTGEAKSTYVIDSHSPSVPVQAEGPAGSIGLDENYEQQVIWRGLFPTMLNSVLPEACFELLRLQVLPLVSMRPLPPRVQAIPLQDVRDIGSDGSRVTDVLAADAVFRGGKLLRSVSEWYSEHLGWKLELQLNAQPLSPNQGSYACMLTHLKNGFQIPLSAHGTGMSQALPVVVRCLAAQQQRLSHSLLTFEEPETNLHPAAHGALADLCIETAKMQPIPLMIETHSEVFLLRVRRRVAEGTLRPEDVNIFWIDENPSSNSALIQLLPLDEDGWIEDWPYGIFAEDAEESRAIARARRKREELHSAGQGED